MNNKFKDVVIKLRRCGFFNDYQHLSDDQLVDRIIQEGKKHDKYGEFSEILEDSSQDDLFFSMQIANLDKKKVWWQDLECDVCRQNKVYKYVVIDFANLSAGYFNPINVQEVWQTDKGPAIITFEESGNKYRYEAQYFDDWLDAEIIFSFISKIMKDNGSPYEFYIHEESCQDIFTVRATPEERNELKKELGWELNK